MDFVALILVLILYFLRPQEWGSIFSGLRPIQLVSYLVILSIFNKKGGFKLKDLFQTPHHWLIFIFFVWTIAGSPDRNGTFKLIQANILFYVAAVLSLTTIPRLKTFLSWWAWLIMAVTILALLSEVGFDPLNSKDLTEWGMRGRLALNLSIFNNPNALAHSIIPGIPMLYFLMFWKKSIGKISGVILILPLLCIYLTQSKGAFLCGAATIVTVLTFGRPKAVQVAILVMSATLGITAVYALPRMGELSKTKTDMAIQGRIAAARFGMECMQKSWWGNGFGRFQTEFWEHGPLIKDEPKQKPHHYHKAAHGTYVQNGADLGYPGLCMLIGILYCCMRTLVMAKTRNVEEERIRRILFSVVFAYAASSWMVDFFYRTILFLFVAATAGFHQILSKPVGAVEVEEEPEPAFPSWRHRLHGVMSPVLPVPQPAVAGTGGAAMSALPVAANAGASKENQFLTSSGVLKSRIQDDAEITEATMKWRRFGIIDLINTLVLTKCVVMYWNHIITTM